MKYEDQWVTIEFSDEENELLISPLYGVSIVFKDDTRKKFIIGPESCGLRLFDDTNIIKYDRFPNWEVAEMVIDKDGNLVSFRVREEDPILFSRYVEEARQLWSGRTSRFG